MKKFLPLLMLILLAACEFAPSPEIIPTIAVLPTLTHSPVPSQTPITPTILPTFTYTPSPTLAPTLTPSPLPTDTPLPTETPVPTETVTLEPTVTLTESPEGTPTITMTLTPELSYTPSLTITNTITPTLTSSFTTTPEVTGIAEIVLLSKDITILPPEIRYNPQTLTAVHFAAETLIAVGTATPPGQPAQPGISTNSPNLLATLPPPPGGFNCAATAPGELGMVLATEGTLAQMLGCPQGSITFVNTAFQEFERGMMIYDQNTSSIYVLTLDMHFRGFPDTWIEGEPDSGGETPPPGLIEPRRGFGKVWRSNPDVRAALGWAIIDEAGGSASLQMFDRGWAIFLPQGGHTVVMGFDPGSASGAWEALEMSF